MKKHNNQLSFDLESETKVVSGEMNGNPQSGCQSVSYSFERKKIERTLVHERSLYGRILALVKHLE